MSTTRSIVFSANNGPACLPQTLDLIIAEIRRTPNAVNCYSLVANTATAVAIPAGTEQVMFNSCNQTGTAQIPFFVSDASVATASLPSATNTNGTASEFMPTQYNVRGQSASGLSAISPQSGYLIVTFYAGAYNGV